MTLLLGSLLYWSNVLKKWSQTCLEKTTRENYRNSWWCARLTIAYLMLSWRDVKKKKVALILTMGEISMWSHPYMIWKKVNQHNKDTMGWHFPWRCELNTWEWDGNTRIFSIRVNRNLDRSSVRCKLAHKRLSIRARYNK